MDQFNNAAMEATLSHEAIARRAHALYEANGCQDGRDVENWLEAERELRASLQSDTAEMRELAADDDDEDDRPIARRPVTPATRSRARRVAASLDWK